MSAHHACITQYADGAAVGDAWQNGNAEAVDDVLADALTEAERMVDRLCAVIRRNEAEDREHGTCLMQRSEARKILADVSTTSDALSGYLPQDDYFPRLPTNHPGVVGERR